MLDDMGIVDVTSSNQPEEFRVNQTVPADCQRERIAPARVRVGHHYVIPAARAMDEKFAGGIREVRGLDFAPGIAVIAGKSA